jgi:hypothetical protein
LFDRESGDGQPVKLLILGREKVRWLVEVLERARHLLKRFDGDTELVIDDRLCLLDLPPHLRLGAGHPSLRMDAVPVDSAAVGFLPKPVPQWARLHVQVRPDGFYWTVDPSGFIRGFRTGCVSWADVMGWRLLMTTQRGVSGVFRRLSEREPDRALFIVERGICFPQGFVSDEPERVEVPRSALDALLSHPERRVREHAISVLERTKDAPSE